MLERRELLSATVVLGAQAFKNIPVTSGQATVNGSNYTALATLSGTVDYTSPTVGTVNANLNGSINSGTDSGEAFSASIANSITQTNNNLTGSVNVTAPTTPTNLAGTANLATGSTFDTAQFSSANTNINWTTGSGGTGQWSGLVYSTAATPTISGSISLTQPYWDSAAENQIDFGFNVSGAWFPTASSAYQTPVTYVDAYWGTTATTETTQIGGAAVPVYWNQATGTASVQGISSATIPTGANYVIFQVQGVSNSLVAFNLATPAVSGVVPSQGAAGGQTPVTINGLGFSGATAVDFGANAATSVSVNGAGTQITCMSPAGTIGNVVNITVTTPAGTSAPSTVDQFTYLAPSFTLTGPTSGTYTAGQAVTIQWTAANVDAGSSVSLAYDTTTNWGNPKWIEVGTVNAANIGGSYIWNTTGVAAGTYYLAGYLYDDGRVTFPTSPRRLRSWRAPPPRPLRLPAPRREALPRGRR